ncbi:MAG TPA: septal ring lytic transglycosylase RlpA family protein [Pelagibacterium sp.]|uniref:septal ring lytic transglycosylase RlpA family protein n=1 Tax=Pelagibacterium sp. TaxID=1967288 RepID=UPI002C72496E|nr:septal ring lytic transglycosylase RlpA family protein [Pelagibacterium sp.]HWJ88027.1 septal ring lytic transglycosylase RlpA family protein [Pelagibacterium sp.]
MPILKSTVLSAALLLGAFPLATSSPIAQDTIAVVQTLSGTASWYGGKFHGRKTANGETYNQHALTAAHRHLPFGTEVVVTNQNNGRSVVVRINDRGPFTGGRIIDLSRQAASQIGMINSGTAKVTVEVIG